MKYLISLALICLMLSLRSSAQSYQDLIKEGNYKNIRKDYQGALQDYLRAFRLKKQDTLVLLSIISAKESLWEEKFESNDNIIFYLNLYVDLKKNDPTVYIFRSEIESNRGHSTDALADLDIAISLDKTNAKAYYEREMLRLGMGDKDGAYMDLKEYQRLNNKSE